MRPTPDSSPARPAVPDAVQVPASLLAEATASDLPTARAAAAALVVAAPLQQTPLHDLHLSLGARMVPFAGYSMPVQYPSGLMAEHRQCRTSAALFDVSHMGQIRLEGAEAAQALESLVPMDIAGLAPGRQRYAFFTDDNGGLLDDLMVVRPPAPTGTTAGTGTGTGTAAGASAGHGFGDLLLIVNAGRKGFDLQHLQQTIGQRCNVIAMPERALLALQGPKAAQALGRLSPGVLALVFMTGGIFSILGAPCFVTRSGYTGEDGFEISVPMEVASFVAEALLAQPEVQPAGLGARDTLRLEAGMCLYGHDIGTSTTPVEAALTWAIQKVRRPGGERAGGYPGAAVIERELATGAARKRVGLIGSQRVPVREGARVFDADGSPLGTVTSGTLSPTVDQPVAMAYLPAAHTAVGTEVLAEVRGKRVPMRVSALPFNPHRYQR